MSGMATMYSRRVARRSATELASSMTSSPRLALVALTGALAFSGRPPADPFMAPGVSRELASVRSKQLSAIRYAMNLSVVARDTARGSITIRFRAKTRGDVVVDFRGPSLSDITVNGAATTTTFNGVHLRIPAASIMAGENVVSADFKTPIAPAGASIIKFHDDKDGNDYLYTLLVPSDANLLFPCFDQPDLKARLTLTLTVPKTWQALANGVTENVARGEAGTVYRFRETDPLPTYLFAFAAGPWKEFSAGGRGTSLWVRASRATEVEVDSLQTQVGSAIASLGRYFGVKYPFQQFQYMLSP